MKYKVGDKVRIKSIDWYIDNKDEYGAISFKKPGFSEPFLFIERMSEFCGKVVKIIKVLNGSYEILEDMRRDGWIDDMFEGLVEEIPKFKPNDIVDTNDNLYGCITDDIEYDKDKKSFKYYVSFIVDGGYYYEYQLKPHKSNKEQMKETNNVCVNAITGNIIAEKDMLSIALSNGLILPKCNNKDLVKMDIGDVSDGYHTFNELYEYLVLYNAGLFNELAKQGLYDVHKSKRHSDGEIPFGKSNWFIVMAELPTGQISKHYEMKDWDLFQIPEKETANKWDGHTPKDVTERIRKFLTPKPKYPTTYEECCKVMNTNKYWNLVYHTGNNDWTFATGNQYATSHLNLLDTLHKLLICRDVYWKIAGEEMGLGEPWNPIDSDYITGRYCIFVCEGNIICNTPAQDCILTFPTSEMRDAFYENFKDLIESCKELL